MTGRSPRRKGDRLERLVVTRFRSAGIKARRVPLSGSARDFPGDIMAELPHLGEILLECKARQSLSLYAWLEGRDGLILKTDRRDPLIVMRLSDFLKILEAEDAPV